MAKKKVMKDDGRFHGSLQWGKGIEPNPQARVYWRKGSPIVRNRHQQVRKGEPVADALNAYYREGGKRRVDYIYKERSSAIWSRGDVVAVRFAKDDRHESAKAWMNRYGDTLTQQQASDFFKAVDATTLAGVKRSNGRDIPIGYMQTIFDNMSPAQQGKVAEILLAMDFETFWDEFYPFEEGEKGDHQSEMYDDLFKMLMECAGGEKGMMRIFRRASA